LLPAAGLLTNYITARMADSRAQILQEAISSEEYFTQVQIKEIGLDPTISKLIEQQDVTQLPVALEAARKAHGLGTLTAVNKDGISIFRTAVPSNSQDYVLESTVWGQAAAQGRSIAAVGVAKSYPLLLAADQPIEVDGKFAGEVIGGFRFDDSYAATIKSKYLSRDAEVAYYSNTDGLIGSTFSDPKIRLDLGNEFNIGSDWIRKAKQDAPIIINGHSYRIKNITFSNPKSGNTDGGILVFYPKSDFLRYFAIVAFLALLLSLFVTWRWRYLAHKPAIRRAIILLMVLALLISATIVGELWYLFLPAVKVQSPQKLLYNSTLSFSPGTDVFGLTSSGRVAVKINTGGESINAVQLKLKFDPAVAKIKDIAMDNSICNKNFIFNKSIDNSAGEADITCGLPSPGFQGTNGIVAELLISPQKEGALPINFMAGTDVLANDGLGTSVLRFSQAGDFRIVNFNQAPATSVQPEQPLSSPQLAKPLIFSSTHPNQELWSQQKKVSFSWQDSAPKYIYSLDTDPSGNPDPSKFSQTNWLDLTVPGDGVYYFHLAAENGTVTGPKADYRVKIDSTPPATPTVKVDYSQVLRGQTVRFQFSGSDPLSGLQKNFYYSLDNGTFLPVGSSLSISFDTVGQHNITVRNFDNAGNFSDSSVPIEVNGRTIVENIWGKIKSFAVKIF
jgi:hypothetical protein